MRSATDAGSSKNSTLFDKITQWEMEYDNKTILTNGDRDRVDLKLGKPGSRNYGNFFKSSDDFGGEFETTSRKLADIEQAKKTDK